MQPRRDFGGALPCRGRRLGSFDQSGCRHPVRRRIVGMAGEAGLFSEAAKMPLPA